MKLNEYITAKGLSQSAFGAQLSPPSSQGLVSQWINGTTRVTLERAIQIEDVTGGEVTVRDCFDMAEQPVDDKKAA
jgi:DNA-binding transcriptional regulator YdaS (Cro superfamily)